MNKRTIYLGIILISLLFFWYYISQSITIFIVDDLSEQEKESIEKLRDVIYLTKQNYVDSVNWDKVISSGIEGMLNSLDPHSVYFSAAEAVQNDEQFEGKYQGIGIQFDVIDGYINVISVIPGSPSEKVGLASGDRIIEINGESAFGISQADVPRKLKGPKGTKVEVSVSRAGFDELLKFDIIRDEVPIFTINTFFMADDSSGYIWLNRFAATTADELESSLIKLEKQGMKRLILDLRGNGGGYLEQSIRVVGKFITGHKRVVFTKTKYGVADEYYTDDYGKSIDRNYPLIVLINSASASASEIVAGAIQDYDRGLVLGTTSFGKGLVQNEYVLGDESRLRLTVSKYYTPSGRLIQKPYKDKSLEEYYASNTTKIDSLPDSLNNNDTFYTTAGREVFGGGGIKPDIEVKYEAFSKSPKLTQKLFEKRIFFEVAASYVNNNPLLRENFQKYQKDLSNSQTLFSAQNPLLREDFERYLQEFWISKSLFLDLRKTAETKDIVFADSTWKNDRSYLENRLKAEIARNVWSENEFWQVILQNDNQFKEALNLFKTLPDLLPAMTVRQAEN